LVSSNQVTALRKDILPEKYGGRLKAAGWELVELFDVIRPAFDQHGFTLMHPYGANDTQLFMPKLAGGKLLHRELEIQIKGKEVGRAISELFEGETLPLYTDSLELLTIYMEKLEFHRDPKWKFNDYLYKSISPSFFDENEKERVNVNLDFATILNSKYRDTNWKGQGNAANNFDSWMVQDPDIVDTVLALGEKGEQAAAVQALKAGSICYDPVFLTKTDRAYESPESI